MKREYQWTRHCLREELSRRFSHRRKKPPRPRLPKPKIEIDSERIRTSIARLTSNSIGELEGLASELQKLDEFIKYETERVQRDIDSLLSGIKIIVETISPWKRSATVASSPNGPARTVFATGRSDLRRNPANA
jgi:hypothetical protein